MNQQSFHLPVKQRIKPRTVKPRHKRADELPGLPMSTQQIEWAIGHNLSWVLSIVQSSQPQ
jgi:hypothetical protein